ncbi:VAMP-associated protein [Lichtheimia hyalospora FSU 10163]|nr:VAMP-associated protein [Lichtheimia hyalospora FSU 10163]
MAVQLDPATQLSFERPLTRLSTEVLLVGNPNNGPVMFKIKTTAPKQYCVRPNAGRIEPHSQIEVQVILQPFSQEPPVDHKCKDKFLIQTAIIKPVYEALALSEMWAITEAEDRESIFQQKIRCAFRPPTATPVTPPPPQQQAQEHVDQKALPPIPTDVSNQEPVMHGDEHQVEAQQVEAQVEAEATSSTPEPVVEEEKPLQEEQQAKSETSSQENVIERELSSPTNEDNEQTVHVEDNQEVNQQQQLDANIEQEETMDTVNKTTMMEDEDDKNRLKQELRQALELVEHLKNQIANMEHERKGEQQPTEKPQLAGAWEKPSGNMSVEEGYPPQMVMTIASLVFVFTYLFF